MNTQTTAALETIDWQQRAEQAEAALARLSAPTIGEVNKEEDVIEELRYLLNSLDDRDSIQALSVAIGALTALPLSASAQAALHHRCFPGLPEGYTHDDIDRLFEWANDADDFLYGLSRKPAPALAPSPVIQDKAPEPASSLPWLQACESGCQGARGAAECRRCPFPVEGGAAL